ncbi:SICAvar, type I (fragment), partial [Plasmodium knowlesi strain H]
NDINGVVESELKELLQNITDDKKWDDFSKHCKDNIGSSWSDDTEGEKTAKQKACKLFASGLKHISDIPDNSTKDDGPLRRTMMCAALNLYADQLISKAENQCPLDNEKLKDAIKYAFDNDNSNATKSGANSCKTGSGTNSCFVCERQSTFPNCKIGHDKIEENMTKLLDKEDESNSQPDTTTPNKEQTLDKINKIETFCTQVQCAIKQKLRRQKNLQNGTEPSWSDIKDDATKELTELIKHMMQPPEQKDVDKYCKDKEDEWYKLGHKQSKTNKAACLHFAAGLQHIYTHGKGQKDPLNAPSFEQTMGCLFLKEYAKQLQTMANDKKKGHSWVHPLCDIDKGITHAFSKTQNIMQDTSPCKTSGTNDCFPCKWDNKDYDNCSIGTDNVKTNVDLMFKDQTEQIQMEKTLENTVCPILITDLLTPFLPLAPVSIGLSAMAYYLWKYFGKGGPRLRRSPADIPGSSVQEQLLDRVEEAGSHEYRLVKERKPRSAPTRTKRSGRVNRRTIIEIHFEVLDECQKGDTQLNQKDFLELLVQEFMGSEFMEEEEQVPKEDVLMESIPLEQAPMERVPSLGSGLMV